VLLVAGDERVGDLLEHLRLRPEFLHGGRRVREHAPADRGHAQERGHRRAERELVLGELRPVGGPRDGQHAHRTVVADDGERGVLLQPVPGQPPTDRVTGRHDGLGGITRRHDRLQLRPHRVGVVAGSGFAVTGEGDRRVVAEHRQNLVDDAAQQLVVTPVDVHGRGDTAERAQPG
jgi:hypothetical protein